MWSTLCIPGFNPHHLACYRMICTSIVRGIIPPYHPACYNVLGHIIHVYVFILNWGSGNIILSCHPACYRVMCLKPELYSILFIRSRAFWSPFWSPWLSPTTWAASVAQWCKRCVVGSSPTWAALSSKDCSCLLPYLVFLSRPKNYMYILWI